MNDRAAILVVNGGKDPIYGRWIRLCVEKIIENTEWLNYKIYVWNNNLNDEEAIHFLESIASVSLTHANPTEELAHFHAVPLQRLYEKAVEDGAKYIITMDNDAHPVQKGWLSKLIGVLDQKTVLAGVWRDELKKAIKPYIHASCLCTTVNFIQSNNLRLDRIVPNTPDKINDTLSIFSDKVAELSLETFPLRRSNKNNFHRLMGGIYGEIIYHHGGGSRKKFKFWDEPNFDELKYLNGYICEEASRRIFTNYSKYVNWLSQNDDDAAYESEMQAIKELGDLAIRMAQESVPSNKHKNEPNTSKKNLFQKYFRKIIKAQPQSQRIQPKNNSSSDKLQAKRPVDLMLKSFSLYDLRPIPDEWIRGKVDFVGVGVPKAGTSWWYALLSQHPQIENHRLFSTEHPVTKELNYFLHFSYGGITQADMYTYKQAFAAPDGSICGEWSTPYLCYPHCIEYLAKTVPETKILVLLRNPVDRTISYLNHVMSNRGKRFALSENNKYLFKVYSTYPEAFFYSQYIRGIRTLLRHYSREQIMVLQYEKCKQNSSSEISRTYRFLGVNDQYKPKGIQDKVNYVKYTFPSLDDKERQRITDFFREEVYCLNELLPEIDLSLWPDFSNS